MEQKYKPSKKEIKKELINIVKKGISKIVKSDFVYYFKDTILINAKVYAIPTWIRRGIEGKELDYSSYVDDSIGKKLGTTAGLFGAVGVGLGQFKLYFNAVNKGHSEILYLPIITNGLSLIYEIGRGIYKKAESNVIKLNKMEKKVIEKRD